MEYKKKIRVLVCDDNADFRKALKYQLYDVMNGALDCIDEACSGEEAMAMVTQNWYQMLFLDIEMPGVNGFETAKYMNIHHPKLRVVALTMHAEREYMERMIYSGARHYLVKDRLDDESIIRVFNCLAPMS